MIVTNPKRWLDSIKSESGNVESALVLIPLMILFLSVAQIGLSGYARATITEINQGKVAYSAMGIPDLVSNSADSELGKSPVALPLPGGGSILIEQWKAGIPSITPLLPGGDSFESTGISVQE